MTETDLTAEQAKAISDSLFRSLIYLGRFRRRMEERGFLPADPLYVLVSNAWDAQHRLSVHVHYLGCDAARRKRDTQG